jgi:anti-sigma factor RsiW
MMQHTDTPDCGYAETLVSYLYGEISPDDSRAFESHLIACSACRADFREFDQVRGSVALWRDDILAVAPVSTSQLSPLPEIAPVAVRESAEVNRNRGKSAVAAIREFLSLSPMWLRAATAFATVAFCALVIFAGWRLTHSERVSVPQVASVPSVREQKPTAEQSSKPVAAYETSREADVAKPVLSRPESTAKVELRNTPRRRVLRRQLEERFPNNQYAIMNETRNRQILSDLGLASREEEAVPRLGDLLGEVEVNN